MTQDELAKLLRTSISVVGRYERDEMTPSIEVAKNISGFLNTTVGYLLGETDKAELFKDPVMLQRLSELDKMEATEKTHILHFLDGFIKSVFGNCKLWGSYHLCSDETAGRPRLKN